ncbi:Slx4p interacting protein [Neurospora sp. IMI 360204]|nr:Slx4p interacting protein [Neurospora sp. IMI 360204]
MPPLKETERVTITQLQPKPIPALYTVYILRSQPRHASLYIGSTPHPPRRLSQHNGLAKGGAYRTSKKSLRPWDMVCLVSGFPSMIAALKFEWALNNPYKSLHIPAEKRAEAVKGLGRRKTGHLKRPRKSLVGVMEALRMLVGVRSFGRWPLRVHFFEEEVWRVWEKVGMKNGGGLKIPVVTDFGGGPTASQGARVDEELVDPGIDGGDGNDDDEEDAQNEKKRGIYALPLDYTSIKEGQAEVEKLLKTKRRRAAAKVKLKGKGKAADEKGNNAEERNAKGNREVKTTTSQRIVEDSEDSEFLDIAYL